jgi:cytochrome c
MFDTMTFTKVIGSVCGALLIYLLGQWAADELYHGGGHYGERKLAYVIIPEDGVAEEEAEPEVEVDFATLLASADPGAGERVFGKCRACHKLEEGANGTGPYLYGVVGREIGVVDGFRYSGALDQAGEVWDAETLNAFLENPRDVASGTSMAFNGLAKPEDRANLIAYLETFGG